MRAAIYARYSSENQRDESIADQVEVCRRYIERSGWTMTETYDDRAASGASRFRPGLSRMIADAEARRFDILVCEAVDRLGRKLSDVAELFDRLTFLRVQVHATSIGLLTPMHVGIMGTMAQMTLADLREKTKRGQLGRARVGRVPGGLAFGYDVVPPPPGAREAGERRINVAEAEIVRRIFRDFAAGTSARGIAHALNASNVSGPDGRRWGDTTIRGQADRGTGILNNTLYIGRLSWNRCSYIKDRRTGRRVARVNDRGQWEEVEVPELRIVEQTLWDAAKTRQAQASFQIGRDDTGQALNRAHRRVFLLSGLLTCGACGGGYTIVGKDRYGCAARRASGICANATTITRQIVERRVLSGLQERMLTPELVEAFVATFEAELARERHEASANARAARDKLAGVERRLEGVLRAIEDGAWNESLRARLTELEQSKASLQAEVKAAANPDQTMRLAPNAAALYRDKVADLAASLSAPSIKQEASEALRALIDCVRLTPDVDADGGMRIELEGDLAAILSLAASGATQPVPVFSNDRLPGRLFRGDYYRWLRGRATILICCSKADATGTFSGKSARDGMVNRSASNARLSSA